MSRYLNLQINEPCHESWEGMQPDSTGRFCGSCRKSVVDFTAMTDAEVVAFLQNRTHVCGRVRADQLGRPMALPRKPLPGLRYFFTITIPALLLSLKSNAQSGTATETTQQAPVNKPVVLGNVASPADSIQGKITDSSGAAIPFATITVKGTKQAVAADAKGAFGIAAVRLPARLIITSTGYDSKEVEARTAQLETIVLSRVRGVLTEVVVVGGMVSYSRKPRRFKSLFKPKPAPAALPASINVYPNPVQSGSNISVDGRNLEKGTYRLELYSLAGQLAQKGSGEWSGEKSNMKLSTTGLLPGNYILRVIAEKTGKVLSMQVVVRN